MFRADYHTHSHHSFDGTQSMLELAKAAVRVGLTELCITDHCDMNRSFDFAAQEREFLETRQAVEGQLVLLRGIELGEATHDLPDALLRAGTPGLDFVIGSYHILKGYPDFYFHFYTQESTCRRQIELYLGQVTEMCRDADFDVLGHLTLPLRYMGENLALRAIDFAPYEEQVREIYRLLIESGRGIEINLSGLRKDPFLVMPDLPLLKLYRQCGGEIVTLGSDSHGSKTVGAWQAEGRELLREAGFGRMAAYRERRLRFESID